MRSSPDETGLSATTRTGTIVKVVVVVITMGVTIIAMRYISRKMEEVKGRVIYARRKARYVPHPSKRSSRQLVDSVPAPVHVDKQRCSPQPTALRRFVYP